MNEHDSIIDCIVRGDRNELLETISRHAERLLNRIANFVNGGNFANLDVITDFISTGGIASLENK